MMVSFKGRHFTKVYIPKKCTKWGYKIWCCHWISGYTYQFEVLGGKGSSGQPADCNPPQRLGGSEFVVLRMRNGLVTGKRKVFFDNLFSSPELIKYLLSKGIYGVATLRANRSRSCPIPAEKDMKKQGRGAMTEVVDTEQKVVVCAWYDNRRALTISNFVGIIPIDECNRYDRAQKKMLKVARPALVALYNRFMGGVDKTDMFMALYKCKCKTSKWYQRITTHLFSLAVVNAWVIYKESGGTGSLLPFLQSIAICLVNGEHFNQEGELSDREVMAKPTRLLKRKHVPCEIHYDGFNHWPVQVEVCSQQCKPKICTRKSGFYCGKCQVFLCMTGSTCFLTFHGVNIWTK